MTRGRREFGNWGEEISSQYLLDKGYAILERNFRTPHGEIDILVYKDNCLVFVEVKTRSSNKFGFPEDAVSPRKQAHMLSAAECYFAQHPDCPETWQFDIIAITRRPGSNPTIEHFENVIK